MACCSIAASMIAFLIKICDVLNVNLNLQYNEACDTGKSSQFSDEEPERSEGEIEGTPKTQSLQ